jgi:hypothetical protein
MVWSSLWGVVFGGVCGSKGGGRGVFGAAVSCCWGSGQDAEVDAQQAACNLWSVRRCKSPTTFGCQAMGCCCCCCSVESYCCCLLPSRRLLQSCQLHAAAKELLLQPRGASQLDCGVPDQLPNGLRQYQHLRLACRSGRCHER